MLDPVSYEDQTPIALTPRAAEAIRGFMKSEKVCFLRVTALGGGPSGLGFGLSLTPSSSPWDFVYEANGITVCIDPETARLARGMRVDHDGSAFLFERCDP